MMNEFFYGAEEPGFMVTTSAQQIIRDPKLFIDSSLAAAKPPGKEEPKKPEAPKPIVMNVSICCNSCVELLEPELKEIKGVKEVTCEIYKKKVTVTGPASVADVLSATRKHFKKAELA
ncbi:hypothetical protein R1sor_022302 [Riccia sorocarpa]|uniref:HMA domain-containing protein n=1 Tax=Riccia sorocarpa TaxID=122646 RepID=A0ABD3GN97_9MARC